MNQTMLRQLFWVCMISFLSVTTGQLDVDVCNTTECSVIDSYFTSVNLNLEPCNDYLKFIVNTSPTPRLESSYDLADFLSDTIEHAHGKEALKKEMAMYKDCQNVKNNEKGKEELMKQWEDMLRGYGADQLFGNNKPGSSNDQWWKIDLRYAIKGFGFAFFNFDIIELEYNYDQPSRHIEISPSKDEFVKLTGFMYERFQNTNHKKFKDLREFINSLNANRPGIAGFDDDERQPDEISIHTWQQKYNKFALNKSAFIDWLSILNQLFDRIGSSKNEHDKIIVRDEKYFKDLAELLSRTNVETIADYVHFRFISKTIGLVDDKYLEYSIIPGIKGLACTPGLMIGTAREYMKKHFPQDNRATLQDIFTSVKGNMVRLQNDKFRTTKEFMSKLTNAKVIFGYPDWLNDDKVVNGFYDKAGHTWTVNSHRLLSSKMYPLEALLLSKLEAYDNHDVPLVDIDVLFKSLQLDDLEFSKDGKQLIIPAKMFSEVNYKFFSSLLNNAINYGAAGSRIAYSIYMMWLKEIGTQHANDFTRCTKDIYHSPEDQLRGTAYLLGLQTAYDAWPTSDSYPIQFKKFGIVTVPEVFFMSYAFSMYRIEQVIGMRDASDFINFAVSNTQGFTDAYGCRSNHKLNLYHKCDPVMAIL